MSYYSEMMKGKHSGALSKIEYAIWLCGTAPTSNERILEAAAKELAELRKELADYKNMYNNVAAQLNTANHHLSEITDLAKRESGLTMPAPDLPKARDSISVTCPICGTFIGVDFGKSASG